MDDILATSVNAVPTRSSETEMNGPALRDFLGMYELLVLVFVHADPHTVTVAARTAKLLSEPALDVLWRYIPRASYLFSVLCNLEGPTSYDGHSSRRYDFERDLHPKDWVRFLKYSRRIEALSSAEDPGVAEGWNEPSHKALAKVSATRPADMSLRDIFPRLKQLRWSVFSPKVLRNLPMLLTTTLTVLDLKIDSSVELKAMTAFLKQLQDRCAKTLLDLSFNTDFHISVVEDDVISFFEDCCQLERLVLPRFWINGRVFTALGSLPCLKYVGQRKLFWIGNADDLEAGLIPSIELLQPESFPALQDITFDTTLLEARRFLGHRFAPKLLTKLCVTSSKLEVPQQLQEFLNCVSDSAIQMVELDVGLTFTVTVAPDHSTDITSDTLRPLHHMRHLTHFGLATHFPVKMNDSDLDEFTSGWTRLRVLWLNETPAQAVHSDVRSQLTLKALRIMAKNCPNLEEMSLFVDASKIPPDGPDQVMGSWRSDVSSIPLPTTFSKLRYLNLGVSHITSSSNTANYIVDCLNLRRPEAISLSGPPLRVEEGHLDQPGITQVTAHPDILPTTRNFTSKTLAKLQIPEFGFDCDPRFWPAALPTSDMEVPLYHRRNCWEDVRKTIPALLEQKIRMETMRDELLGLVEGLRTTQGG